MYLSSLCAHYVVVYPPAHARTQMHTHTLVRHRCSGPDLGGGDKRASVHGLLYADMCVHVYARPGER